MSNTSDAETVYVTSRRDHYHTSADCRGLSHANLVVDTRVSRLADDVTLCKLCADEYEPPASSDPLARMKLLEELDPDDVG